MSKIKKESTATVDIMPNVFSARSVICRVNQGFNNFCLVTVTIKDGEVIKYEESPPYASFECLARMEVQAKHDLLKLTQTYTDGRVNLVKGE